MKIDPRDSLRRQKFRARRAAAQQHKGLRPPLQRIPLADAMQLKPGTMTLTMSEGQWDTLLQVGYDQGFVLLELDEDEVPVAGYQRPPIGVN
jgi:hypothetical protein